MADCFGRVKFDAKVMAVDRKIGGDGHFFSRPQAEQGAVVADAQLQPGIAHLRRTGANAGQEG